MLPTLSAHFSDLTDPRLHRTRLHSLTTIPGIALCAVICAADTCIDIEQYGKARQEWLSQGLELTRSVPSLDTFARVLARLNTSVLGGCLQALPRLLVHKREKHRALDGNYLRHSFDTASEQGPRVMRNAWACGQRLVLASLPAAVQSSAIKAIPELLALRAIPGGVVTIEARGTQTDIAAKIKAAGGDYVSALKGSQETLHKDVRLFFEHAIEQQREEAPYAEAVQINVGQGRTEKRRCLRVPLSDLHGAWDDYAEQWTGLASLIRLESERTAGAKTSQEMRCCLSSLPSDAARPLRTIGSHWGVEKGRGKQPALCAGVSCNEEACNEEACRVRKDHAPATLALRRQLALNRLRQEKTQPNGRALKRSKAGWDATYLFKALDSCSQF